MNNRKLLLSGSLIVIFLLYGLHQREGNDDVHVIAPNLAIASPTPLPATPAPTVAPTPTASDTSAPATPVSTPEPAPTPTPAGRYKNGTYTGSVADAYYGNVQVEATISGGKLTGVQFLQYPNDRPTSRQINGQAMPYLQQEAIQAQSAQVDGVSGASDTSQAFVQSLSSALSQAQP